MRTNRTHLMFLAALACLPLACKDGGCGGSSASSDDAGAASSASAALTASGSSSAMASSSAANAMKARQAMMVRAGGATGALFRGAAAMDLSDDQKDKIEKIATELRDADKVADENDAGGPRKEMKALHDELVTGVKAGKIDSSKLEPHYTALEKEAKERNLRETEAIGKLHDVLDADQRKKLSDTVKKQEDDRNERAKKQEAMAAAHAGDAGTPSPSKRRYERWGKELDLDADQKKKMDAVIPPDDPKAVQAMRDDAQKRMTAVVDMFSKDTFDAKSVPAPDIKLVRKPMDEQVKFFNGLLPILKPEQKEKLATRLEKQQEGAMSGLGMPGMPGGMPGEHGRPMGRPGRPGFGGPPGEGTPPQPAEDDSH